ncbi:hypothetical protein SGLAD_v1c02380 [Spiroplasma gladiatoris]|uniref:Uncharacterized protein n=1 Tax=Spiroplasma gladiatoris TaxID=2143 RepID=A0A4P7AH04_9MOLU|nr:hypothetical protein [Spiroplasma gladiatoris]QBQ07437.1 hypothetical protein SGLAD_v1c02380 [Spiroplasma gladiatoris]
MKVTISKTIKFFSVITILSTTAFNVISCDFDKTKKYRKDKY